MFVQIGGGKLMKMIQRKIQMDRRFVFFASRFVKTLSHGYLWSVWNLNIADMKNKIERTVSCYAAAWTTSRIEEDARTV